MFDRPSDPTRKGDRRPCRYYPSGCRIGQSRFGRLRHRSWPLEIRPSSGGGQVSNVRPFRKASPRSERDRAVVFQGEVEEPTERDREGLHLRIAGMIRPDVLQFPLRAPRLGGREPVAAMRAGIEHLCQLLPQASRPGRLRLRSHSRCIDRMGRPFRARGSLGADPGRRAPAACLPRAIIGCPFRPGLRVMVFLSALVRRESYVSSDQ